MPAGFDAGLLNASSLRVPAVAARVRLEFADVLDAPAERVGGLGALAELRSAHPAATIPPSLPHLLAHAAQATGRSPTATISGG